ncbi:hypothetical protein CC86DRAFT_158539 [Ophiobolus disseminans]|uniref:Uncharacterized protein n=1 Tax=Ophiobolus disseminans TaxID=1469910 RepID=A0A6A6ZB88_9PLEO|nr:hypothetical protein CC86DRAFT_158539 [Ophiobolus disseminans]
MNGDKEDGILQKAPIGYYRGLLSAALSGVGYLHYVCSLHKSAQARLRRCPDRLAARDGPNLSIRPDMFSQLSLRPQPELPD